MPARAEETRSGAPGKVRSTFLGRGDAAEGESRAASGAARVLERAGDEVEEAPRRAELYREQAEELRLARAERA